MALERAEDDAWVGEEGGLRIEAALCPDPPGNEGRLQRTGRGWRPIMRTRTREVAVAGAPPRG
jgi:hypothetical protein